jgi:hypothetical protein
MDFLADVATGASGAAAYARAAARLTAECHRLRQSGGRPAQIRALEAMADLFRTLAQARRARDEADRRLAQGPVEALEDILGDRPVRPVPPLRGGAGQPV